MDQIPASSLTERPKAPRPDEVELRFSPRAVRELERLLTHYPDKKSAMLPALWIAQREYGGYLPREALLEVAVRLGRSYAEVEGVATFYTMYHVAHPVGRHVIEVCTCLSCYLCGAYRILDYLKERLGLTASALPSGEGPGVRADTPDGMFTIEEVECLNACDRAPVLMVGDQYIGPVTPEDVDALLDRLSQEDSPTTVRLADEIVQCQLHKGEQG
ncbi:MAG: NAD(P)H-dependent oxidoreductase subunit E [Armatimonadota bacterium]